jgi:glycerol transport system ATP-binding protein
MRRPRSIPVAAPLAAFKTTVCADATRVTMKRGLELDNVTRIVDGEMHLEGVRMRLEPGSFTVLLGRTRAGKTSLLRLLAGLDHPTSGRILEGGADVTRVHVRSRDVAMVYQQFVNYPSLTVYENIASPLRLRKKLDKKEIDRRVRETAALLRLEGLLHRLPSELSGGQQQRTAIARALAKDAGLVLLDEPLANLDYKLREELRSELQALFHGRDSVVVYATSEPGEALALGGRTAVLDEGRLLQMGPAVEVYNAPATDRVGQVFSDPPMNLLDIEVTSGGEARITGDVALSLTGHLRALSPGKYRLGVRANHVRLAPSSEADQRLPSTVLLEEISGSETLLYASSGTVSITAQIPGVHRHALGAPVDLFLATGRLFAFTPDGKLAAAPSRAQSSAPALNGTN